MKNLVIASGAALLLMVPFTNVSQAQVRDAAELLPATTLAYAEISQPGKLAAEISQLIKGSALENLPQYLAKYRTRKNVSQGWVLQQVGIFGVFVNPEVLNEMGRIQGAAVALTGFTKENQPDVVWFMQGGQSNAPTFFMRASLTMMEMRIVAEVDKVSLYQQFGFDYSKRVAPGGAPVPDEAKFHGPVFALLNDTIVIGSSVESVKDVVSRHQGKSATPSLASVDAFKQTAAVRDRPGICGYLDFATLFGHLVGPQKEALGINPFQVEALKILVNPKAVKTVAGSLSLQEGDLSFQVRCGIDPKEKSAVLELLSDKPAGLEILHSASREGIFTVAMGFPEGEKRWQKILELADAFAKAAGKPEELLPSQAIAEAEKRLGIQIGKEVFGKLKGMALTMDLRGDGIKEGERLPLLSVQAEDEAGAKKIEELAPQMLDFIGWNADNAPETEKVLGYTIHTVSDPRRFDVHYGRQGSLVVFGQNRKLVAEALQGWEKKTGVFGDVKIAEVLKRQDNAVAVGTWSLGESATLLLQELGSDRNGIFDGPGGPGKIAKGSGSARPENDPLAKHVKAMGKLIEPLPPSTIVLGRKPDSLTLEVRQQQLRSVSARMVDILVEAALDSTLRRNGAVIEEAVPVPVPPPPPPPKGSGSKGS